MDAQFGAPPSARRLSSNTQSSHHSADGSFSLSSFWVGLEIAPAEHPQIAQITQRDFETGELICNTATDTGLWIVCAGRVRLLCDDPHQHRLVSCATLEAGETFGTEATLVFPNVSYQVIGSGQGQVAFLPPSAFQSLLSQSLSLRSHLLRHAEQRSLWIFLKTQTAIGNPGFSSPLSSSQVNSSQLSSSQVNSSQISNSQNGTSLHRVLKSEQLRQLSTYLRRVELAPGSPIAEVSGCCWLYQGTIQRSTPEAPLNAAALPLPILGDRWGYPAAVSADWIAETTVILYQIPVELWDGARAIDPDLWQSSSDLPTSSNGAIPSGSAKKNRSKHRFLQAIDPTSTTAGKQVSGKQAAPSQAAIEADPHSKSSSQGQSTVINFPTPQRQRRRYAFWRGVAFIQQQSSSDCGVACLAMISQYWGKRYPLHQLREWAKVGRSGATLRNLANTAEKLGFMARPVRASLGKMTDQRNPWIAHWQGEHYVVVSRIRGNKLVLVDPALGPLTLSKQEFLAGWTGYALILEPTRKLIDLDTESSQSLGKFVRLLMTYRGVLGQIILLSLLVQVFGLFGPLFTQIILDQVITQKSLPALHIFTIGLVLFSVWRIGLTAVRQYLLDYFSNRLNLTLVVAFMRHTLSLPLKFFEDRNVGDIITRIQENSKIQMFLIRQAVSTWLDAIMAIVYLGLMFYYNWKLALLVLSLIPPMVLLTLCATPFLKQISREAFKESAEQTSLVVEMLTGIAAVKTAAIERETRWRWEDRLVRMLNVQFKGQKLANGLQVMSGLINTVGSTALLWYGATLVIQGHLSIGQMVAFNMLIGNVLGPTMSVIGVWDELQEVLISVERLNDVFAAKPEESADDHLLSIPAIRGMVRFDQVSFRYEESQDKNILQNLAFEIQPGEMVAIVGRSGSGKTTLVKLLQGMYHPSQGRILIDDYDLRHVSPQSLRSQLGVVPQECFLFSGTILDNIQLYRPNFTLEDTILVSKLAEAHSFIQDLPLGYSTKVGERGTNLSGGQRQRIAIARALLGDPAILILDEATSALDTESERRFQQNLERISRDRTTFIIAHRLSTIQRADRILVLDRGILAEQGNHETLMAQGGIYYHLAKQQLNL
jgi:ATP-binding cassette, subfamily B, bacterial HlyB/CyaB